MKKNILRVLLSLCLVFSLGAQTFEGKGADSPEDAVKNYLNALKACDYNQIISCYAVETFVENYSIDRFIENLNCATVTMKMIYPKDDLLRETGKFEVLASINKMIKYQIWNLSGSDFFKKSSVIALRDNVQSVIDEAFPSNAEQRLRAIKFNEFVPLEKILTYYAGNYPYYDSCDEDLLDEFNQTINKNLEKSKKIYGCKDIKDVTASFYVEGTKYYFLAETIKYGKKWYISPNQGVVACISGMDIPKGCISAAEELEWAIVDKADSKNSFVIKREGKKVTATLGGNPVSDFSNIDRTDPTEVLAAFFVSYFNQSEDWKNYVEHSFYVNRITLFENAWEELYGLVDYISVTINPENFHKYMEYYTIRISAAYQGETVDDYDQVSMCQDERTHQWFVVELPR